MSGDHNMNQKPVAKYDPIELYVLHSHIAGVLFDFMGWLTSREKRLTLSSTDEAGPAVEAITEFAKMRDLRLEDAQVEHWRAILTTPPAAQQEPVAWMTHTNDLMPLFHRTKKGALNWQTQPTPLYTAPRQWVGLTDEPCAMRHSFDGYGYKYIDSGSGSNWQEFAKRNFPDAEPLYEHRANGSG
jgi:hypothetical protein